MKSLSQKVRLLHRALRYRYRLDPLEIKTMLSVLKPGDVSLDIGAHKGGYLYWMQRSVGAQGLAVAFEPQPTLADYLRSVKNFLKAPQLQIENKAVSDKSGLASFYFPEGRASTGASLEGAVFSENNTSTQIPIVSLDDFITPELLRGRRLAFIKCDTEAHELKVFQGAKKTLEQHRPALLFECEARTCKDHTIFEVFSYLQSLGYQGSFFFQNQKQALKNFNPKIHQNLKTPGMPNTPNYANNFLFE